VEDTMYLPGWWEVKAVGIRGNDLRDLEGALSSRSQLLGGEVNLQVVGVKPNLRSYFPGGKFCSYTFFDSLSSLGVSGGSLFASSIKEFESFIKGREERFPNCGVSSGLKAHHERERCLVGDGMSSRVM